MKRKLNFMLFFLIIPVLCHANVEPFVWHFNITKSGGWSLRKDFLQQLIQLFGSDVFIESGTSYGGTTKIAKELFKEVHTIELEDQFYQKAATNFSNDRNVHVYHGDSGKLLPTIIKNLKNRSIIFWLDGHFSGGSTAKGESNTPIMAELKAIKETGIINSIILIDDICCFHPDNKEIIEVAQGYPTMDEIRTALLEINAGYEIILYGDIAIAYPASYQISVSPLIRAMTVSRFFTETTMAYQDVLAAESIIANQTTQQELEALWDQCTYHFGWHRTYPYLWYSLALMGAGRFAEAYDNFKNVIETGYDDWRVYWYTMQAAYRSGKEFEPVATALWKRKPLMLATRSFTIK